MYPGNSNYAHQVYVAVSDKGKLIAVADTRQVAEAFKLQYEKDSGEFALVRRCEYFVEVR